MSTLEDENARLRDELKQKHSDYLQEHHAHYSEAELRKALGEVADRLRAELELIEKMNADNAKMRGVYLKERQQSDLQKSELTEALELARTYTGIEAQGCPLCTYKDGVFIAYCSLHRQLNEKDRLLREKTEEFELFKVSLGQALPIIENQQKEKRNHESGSGGCGLGPSVRG